MYCDQCVKGFDAIRLGGYGITYRWEFVDFNFEYDGTLYFEIVEKD